MLQWGEVGLVAGCIGTVIRARREITRPSKDSRAPAPRAFSAYSASTECQICRTTRTGTMGM